MLVPTHNDIRNCASYGSLGDTELVALDGSKDDKADSDNDDSLTTMFILIVVAISVLAVGIALAMRRSKQKNMPKAWQEANPTAKGIEVDSILATVEVCSLLARSTLCQCKAELRAFGRRPVLRLAVP
eukprot:6962061-Pyramimonas_sp.AAC.1